MRCSAGEAHVIPGRTLSDLISQRTQFFGSPTKAWHPTLPFSLNRRAGHGGRARGTGVPRPLPLFVKVAEQDQPYLYKPHGRPKGPPDCAGVDTRLPPGVLRFGPGRERLRHAGDARAAFIDLSVPVVQLLALPDPRRTGICSCSGPWPLVPVDALNEKRTAVEWSRQGPTGRRLEQHCCRSDDPPHGDRAPYRSTYGRHLCSERSQAKPLPRSGFFCCAASVVSPVCTDSTTDRGCGYCSLLAWCADRSQVHPLGPAIKIRRQASIGDSRSMRMPGRSR